MTATITDPFMAGVRPTGLQRGRNGFYRGINDVPWVSDPDGTLTKSGDRKGLPRRIPYGSPSNRGMQIENSTNLTKWGERRCVFGIGRDPAIVEMCVALAELDIDSDEYKTAADAVIIAAKDAAKAHLAADRGTHVHLLTEDFDEGRDWVARAEAGELVDLDRELQNALVAGWHRMLAEQQMQVLAVEATCVDDTWRLAGTLDRIVRTGKALRFAMVTGEVVEIPAGTVLVGDVKTSNKRLDRSGVVQYWQAFAIQIASYAQSRPYDTETEQRGDWPWPISQTHAVIMHPDIDTAEWELIYVDLEAGRAHGGQCVVDAKAWEQRNDIFSVSQLDAPQSTPATTVEPATEDARVALVAEPSPAERLALVDARSTLCAEPDQGADWSDPIWDEPLWTELKALFDTLDPAGRSWRGNLVSQAQRRLVAFHAQEIRTERSWWLNKAVIALGINEPDDDILRALMAPIVGDVAWFVGVEPGHILGSMNATEAEHLAALVDAYNAPPPAA